MSESSSSTAAPSLQEFRESLRAWLEANLDPAQAEITDAGLRRRTANQLYDAGFLGLTWPEQYGGRGLTAEYQTAFNEVAADYSWAMPNSLVTVGIVGPTLLDHASEELKLRHLPGMLRGDEAWTQLLSEPGAGSDLAGVTTRAVRDGDVFVLNGQKVWTSGAVEADYGLALVRTDPEQPKYLGMSMMVVDMKTPGIDIRPLRQMTGESHFNEVFIDDVRVPVENLVGPYNGGWKVLSSMLFHERMALSAGTPGNRIDRDSFRQLVALAHRRGVDKDPAVREALVETYMQQRLLDYMGTRMRLASQAGFEMGPVGSIGKIGIARSARTSGEAGILIGGLGAVAWTEGDAVAASLARDLLHFPMTGIAGGTTEIQKNTVAERVLGLPREDRPDRDLPFSQTRVNTASK